MDTGLEAERIVDALARNLKSEVVDDTCFPRATICIFLIHIFQLMREDGRLITARTSAELEDHRDRRSTIFLLLVLRKNLFYLGHNLNLSCANTHLVFLRHTQELGVAPRRFSPLYNLLLKPLVFLREICRGEVLFKFWRVVHGL